MDALNFILLNCFSCVYVVSESSSLHRLYVDGTMVYCRGLAIRSNLSAY